MGSRWESCKPTLRNFDLWGVALKHSPLQQIFNVLNFKAEYEAKHGVVKSEALSKMYEDKILWANPEEAALWLQHISSVPSSKFEL